MNRDRQWLSAAEASRILGVNRQTLYAYVSRGYLRSEARGGRGRERRYPREDVERLRARSEERRDPAKAAEHALHWGLPILESSITLISNGRLYYRGHDVARLALESTVGETTSLLWTRSFGADFSSIPIHVIAPGKGDRGCPIVARWQSALAIVGARDPLAYDLRPRAVAGSGWRILNLLTSVAAETADLAGTIEETLAAQWCPGDRHAIGMIRAALILSADHELNVSSFTARCVASAGANPYAVVIAGLSAIEGTKHGGVSARVEALFDDLQRTRDLGSALTQRLRRGEPIEGFGHRLYRGGDPRARLLMEMLEGRYSRSGELSFAQLLERGVEDLLREKPTLDFALTALARTLRLPPGAPLMLFALGRTIGWIAHAIEQYQLDAIIRPRARYVGKMP